MTAPLADTSERQFAAAAEEGIVALAATRDAVGLGPGIGRARETTGLVRALAKRLDLPLALDADGVVAFAGELDLLRGRRAPTVLTPHPGEAAAVLGVRPAQIHPHPPLPRP